MKSAAGKPFLQIVMLRAFIACLACASAQPAQEVSENNLVRHRKSYTIDFVWQGDSLNSVWEPHAAMLVPVRINSCPGLFFMQFDLGSPYSLLYKNELTNIQGRYPNAVSFADSATVLDKCTLWFGKTNVQAKKLPMTSMDEGKPRTDGQPQVIGTIGMDLIDNKVALIDYPEKRIWIGNDVPPRFSNLPTADFIYTAKRILLPVVLKGKKTLLFFDTGASAFELLTSKETFGDLRSQFGTMTHYPVKSWNNVWTAYTAATSDSLEIGMRTVAIRNVTYMEGVGSGQAEQMKRLGIGGMTGNKLFLNNRLLLDTRRKKLAVF